MTRDMRCAVCTCLYLAAISFCQSHVLCTLRRVVKVHVTIRTPPGFPCLFLGSWGNPESRDSVGCESVGRMTGCRGWQPAAADWSGGFRREIEEWPHRPGPTRGRHCERTDAPRGDGCPYVGDHPRLCLHLQVDQAHTLKKEDRA